MKMLKDLYKRYEAIDPCMWWAISNWMLPKTPSLASGWQLVARRASSGIFIFVYVDDNHNVMISDGWYAEPCSPEQFKAFCEGRITFGGCEITMTGYGVWFDDVNQMLGFEYI